MTSRASAAAVESRERPKSLDEELALFIPTTLIAE
jgi:hypothetical protein